MIIMTIMILIMLIMRIMTVGSVHCVHEALVSSYVPGVAPHLPLVFKKTCV